MALIGLHGSISEGKDTVANILTKHLPKFENKKFADKLKQITGILTGVDPINFEKEEFKNTTLPDPWKHPLYGGKITYRFLLMYIGTELMRDRLDNDIWVNSLLSDYKQGRDRFLITDLRFVNEYNAIQNNGGINILVRRFKKVSEWLRSESFKGIFVEGRSIESVLDFCFNNNDTLIWKQELVTKLNLYIGIINQESPNWKKLNHVSERQIYDEKNNIKPFDYIIDNDSTIEDLVVKVEELSREIKNKFL